MASDAEPAKLLLPFLQRADELQKHEPLVAYYCRLYAMDRGLKIPQKERTKTTNALLVSLMNQLEKDKKSLKLGSEDNLHVEGFASNVFAKADKQDRAGRADLNTAKTFYAASIFFEVLNQFGELAPDIEQKLKYSVWKAADIRKALKEGRRPEPGPPGGDKDLASSSPRANTNVVDSNESIQAKFSGGLSTEQKSEQHFHDLGSGSLNYNGANDSSQPSHKEIKRSDSLNYGGASASSHQPDMGHNESISYSGAYVPSTKISPRAASLPSPYSAGDFAASDYPQSYPHTYLQQSYASYEQQQQQQQAFVGQSHHPTENPYSYPNFQSYPSFQESTFPAVPTQHHSLSSCVAQYGNVNGNQAGSSASLPPAARYKYDSNYQPPAEKIAEAHRAAKFAVGALAFDDVSVAVDFLRQSLELLTNPSADLH